MTLRPRMLVFRSSSAPVAPPLPPLYRFRVFAGVAGALAIVLPYARLYGALAAAKMVAKLGTRRRFYYCIEGEDRIVSDGWILAGWCATYEIGSRDYVIGPIATIAAEQGRGLAHLAMSRALIFCFDRGARWVYADTTADNIASCRTMEKSGMPLYREADPY